jgi:hypothetical protein
MIRELHLQQALGQYGYPPGMQFLAGSSLIQVGKSKLSFPAIR